MSDWNWITDEGSVGELPVRVLPDQTAEFLDFVEGVMINYENTTSQSLGAGDRCILTAKIVDVDINQQPVWITVEPLNVEFLRRSEPSDSEIDDMMVYLDGARKRRERERREKQCENCETIDSSTRLSVETKIGNRELHHCANCERLLSVDEYERWMSANR
ncbi:hypothetical protein [Halorubrum coriense]|uniref:hypothetical protein n=1 Tax=Halorubrum coriense TaxID=64713 RepID=UPI0012686C9B|nr:hypothetical protein [Halorubrum coriense]QRG24175.1 hypothetical protein HrrHm1_330 [Halorubrum virus Humcor1]